MNSQVVKKEILSPDQSLNNELNSQLPFNPELTQDLTPENTPQEKNVISVDFQAKKRLEDDLALNKEAAEAAAIEKIRAQIEKIQQQAAQGKEYLRPTTVQEIQALNQPLRLKSISSTTRQAYEIFAGKAARKAIQERDQAQNSGKNSPLDAIGKILRFGTSAGEDDTNQKAA